MEPVDFNYDIHKNYNLKIKKETYIGKGLIGLLNLGNKCYINSILQCLSHTLKLTDYILSADYVEDQHRGVNEYYILHSYVTLINNMWKENQLIKPKSFIENMGKFHPKYFNLQQQDSHECLLYILELLHKALSYEIEVEIQGEIKNHSDILMKKYLDNWSKFYEKDYSFIIETFNGSLVNNIKCKSCNTVSEIFEPYNNLSLSISDTSSTLEQCLDDFFGEYSSIDTWKCEQESCKNEQSGCIKSVDLWTLPNHFIINLKRFKGQQSGKNINTINFPLTNLDLTKYISKEKSDKNNYIYDCYAINYHSGNNCESGHYYSACKNLDGNWYNFNDGNVYRYHGNSTSLSQQLVTADVYNIFFSRRFILNPKTM